MLQLSEGEKQILDAILSIELYPDEEETGKKLISTPENLRKRGKVIQEWALGKQAKLADWANAFESLVTKGFIQQDSSIYVLTSLGRPHAVRARRERVGNRFSNILIRSEKSKAYSSFCERVFGRDLCQANMMDMMQLEKLLEVLNLTEKSRVLDMGCGIGKIAEYISDVTKAHVLGIDIATDAIKHAQMRTKGKKNRLEFREDDLNNLSLPPASVDTIIAIATLHYTENLEKTIGQMKAVLRPHGQMGLFSFQYCFEKDTPDILLPDKTHLAQALKKHNLSFKTWDFTEREKKIWRLQLQIGTELMEEFRAEGNLDLVEDRIEECEVDLPRLEAGKKRRYLYHVQLP
ncbi:MAG: class I SAM-dependent methyltransferase [Candidatus Hermodarchaeota archaeon]